jgi:hypothetical protein
VSIVGALVEVEFSPEADALLGWAIGQVHPIISAVTDSQGVVTFQIAAAGCVLPEHIPNAPWVAQVAADHVVLQQPIVVSPDVVNSLGQLPVQAGGSICEEGVTTVGLSDAVFHTKAITSGLVEPCSNFTDPFDDPVGIGDAVILTQYIRQGVQATCEQ